MSTPQHKIVVLEACRCPVPSFDVDHELEEHYITTPDQVLERIRDATIVVTTIVPILPSVVRQCNPGRLKLLVVWATGCGWLEEENGWQAYRDMGITVINCPQTNIPAVSEHALGLYFAVRKRIVDMHNLTTSTDSWVEHGTMTKFFPGPPPSLAQETVGIIGYGFLGQAIERLCMKVGFKEVIVAERRNATARPGRRGFDEVVRNSTVLMICCPKTAETTNLIGMEELQSMHKDVALINMARGGIVDETALAKALREGIIHSAATDVLEAEPAGRGQSPLLPAEGEPPIPGLTISPHVSWFSKQTIKSLQTLVKAGIEGFVAGKPINVVIGPKE